VCVSTCRLPYPDGPSGCIWLLLPHSLKPSPISERLGIRISAHADSHAVVFRGCKVRLMLRPIDLLALHRQGLLHSSFHLQSRLFEMSNMTTRVHSQFPRPDLHRQHTQHCGLRRKMNGRLKRVGNGKPERHKYDATVLAIAVRLEFHPSNAPGPPRARHFDAQVSACVRTRCHAARAHRSRTALAHRT